MRASIQEVTRVIKSEGVPKQITQQPFDFDPGHYRRLCDLGDQEPVGSDLMDYALDMQYMPLQPELLRYLTPVLLKAWRCNLFEGRKARYAGFVEQLWPALLKGEALHKIYSEVEQAAFAAYMRDSILDRLDAEESLHFSGMGASPYLWVDAFVSYGMIFPDVESLWGEWWQMKTSGHAIAAFQYASALMYEADRNPVFDAWTPEKGGGSPPLWSGGGLMFDLGWKTQNLDFLKKTLNADYLEQKLRFALGQISDRAVGKVASGMLDDFPSLRARVELRIEQLSQLLLNTSQTDGFII